MSVTPAPLIGGAYQARSLIANAQRCINLYPELNQGDGPFPTTHYPTPGLTLFSAPPAADLGRAIYTSTGGTLYAVVGSTLYRIDRAGTWTNIGTITYLVTPVSMVDNGITLLVVDGTATGGWTADLGTDAFAVYADPNFAGSTRIDYVDSRFVFNQPGTKIWYLSSSNSTAIPSANIASKVGYADPIQTVIVLNRMVWLLGTKTSEPWGNSGAADFPFAILPGVFIEHGCAAPYSVAKSDVQVFWLSQDAQGQTVVLTGIDNQARRISTHSIEKELETYGVLSDAVGYTYQQGGHTFYQLSFPSADKTWVYDVSTKLWHQRAAIDSNGALHRHASNGHAVAYGKNLVIDWMNGNIYYYDQTSYTDNGAARLYLRSFPHMQKSNQRITYKYLTAEFDVGNAKGLLTSNPPKVSLRYSDDAGNSWGNPVLQDLGSSGQYKRSVKWARLGMGRRRVFELSWSASVKTALNGASLDPEAMAS